MAFEATHLKSQISKQRSFFRIVTVNPRLRMSSSVALRLLTYLLTFLYGICRLPLYLSTRILDLQKYSAVVKYGNELLERPSSSCRMISGRSAASLFHHVRVKFGASKTARVDKPHPQTT